MIYLSQLVGNPVYDLDGEKIGVAIYFKKMCKELACRPHGL